MMKEIKELNKKVLIIIPILLTILIIAGVGVRSYVSNNQPDLPNSEPTNENTQPTEDVQPTESTTEDDIFTVALPTEFKPFECSKNDNSFVSIWYNGDNWFDTDIYTEELYYVNGEKRESFSFPSTMQPCAYIGNALFLCDYDKRALYRIIIGEDGNYDLDSFSLVTDFYARPAFVDENKLLLYANNKMSPDYVLLNTLTGKFEETDDCNKLLTEIPSGLISAKEAEKIALKEIQKSEYMEEVGDLTFTTAVDNHMHSVATGEIMSSSTELVYRPDLSNSLGSLYQYENIPDYCWFVHTIAEEDIFGYPQVIVCVNAQTGSVAHVRILLPD